jgi:capsular polysaccharide transport system permease protein
MSDDRERPGVLAVRPGRGRKALSRRRDASSDQNLQPAAAPIAPAPTIEAPLPAWPEAGQHAQLLLAMRRHRRRRFFLRLGLFVGLPTLAVLIYTLAWATPRYVSKTEVIYQTYKPTQTLASGLAQSFLGTSQTNLIDLGSVLDEYIQSPALLDKLDEKLHLRAYYSDPKIDYFSRLNSNASREWFLNYYHWRVSTSLAFGGYLTVTVTAFDPEYARALAKAVVEACDEMIDGLTTQPRQDEVRFAEAEVARQEERVRRARAALTEFQNAHGDLEPQNVATQIGQIAAGLESQLTATRAELTNLLSYMSAGSPPVMQVKLKISALEDQLRRERERLANSKAAPAYSQTLDQYSALELEQEFAKTAYLAAQQGLAVARAQAARKQNYLVAFAPPATPDRPTIYFPLLYTLGTFLISLLAYVVGSLMAGALRDQAGF